MNIIVSTEDSPDFYSREHLERLLDTLNQFLTQPQKIDIQKLCISAITYGISLMPYKDTIDSLIEKHIIFTYSKIQGLRKRVNKILDWTTKLLLDKDLPVEAENNKLWILQGEIVTWEWKIDRLRKLKQQWWRWDISGELKWKIESRKSL